MTFSTSSNVEDVFTYPAITVCVTMDVNFTNGFDNVEWLEPEKYDFTFPYLDLGIIKDGKFRQVYFNLIYDYHTTFYFILVDSPTNMT